MGPLPEGIHVCLVDHQGKSKEGGLRNNGEVEETQENRQADDPDQQATSQLVDGRAFIRDMRQGRAGVVREDHEPGRYQYISGALGVRSMPQSAREATGYQRLGVYGTG